MQKALKTANSEKFVFSCQTSNVVPGPPTSLVFGRNRAPDVRRALDSVFCPDKHANSSPLSLSPFASALSPLAFGSKKRAKAAQFPSSGVAGFSAARQPAEDLARSATARRGFGLRPVSPPSLSPLMSPLRLAPFLVQKALKTVNSEKSVFRVRRQVGCLSLKFRSFSVERRSLCSGFRFQPGKQANSIPPSLSPFVTASSPLSLGPKSAQKASSREDFVLGKFESIMERAVLLMGKVGSLMGKVVHECPAAGAAEKRQLRQASA